ncbi:exodeoxyribonuclease VII small subunit [Streptacidiphilus fuscans]|uniref:Exodeoxyribonuclease 7 small subunit n=1 Tax=Streptacidiphilus fuscans TaxID=2789292 RepID=A0A931B004_9ACTN|nr:exodeoxyribonuclease VII small subunit [Streptacidiphilus fuscans]MBF9067708.1 exodeoxyribonuclease VII small subunit [Streptacidiphilus fuscans]
MATKQAKQDLSADNAMGYEQARDELLDVVRKLETGGGTLEESLALWERGEQLAKVCERWLNGARARLDAALAAEEDAAAGDEEADETDGQE